MEKELRKQQSLLMDAGMGVIMFGIWSVARVNLYMGMSSEFLELLYTEARKIDVNTNLLMGLFWGLVIFVLVIFLGVRLYIGLSALADGKGREKGIGYLVVSAILLMMDLSSAWQNYVPQLMQEISPSVVISAFLELTSLYVFLELLIAGIRVKRLRKM